MNIYVLTNCKAVLKKKIGLLEISFGCCTAVFLKFIQRIKTNNAKLKQPLALKKKKKEKKKRRFSNNGSLIGLFKLLGKLQAWFVKVKTRP